MLRLPGVCPYTPAVRIEVRRVERPPPRCRGIFRGLLLRLPGGPGPNLSLLQVRRDPPCSPPEELPSRSRMGFGQALSLQPCMPAGVQLQRLLARDRHSHEWYA